MKKLVVAVTVWPLTELYWLLPGRFDFPFFVTALMALLFLLEVNMENLEFDFSALAEDVVETDEVKKQPGIHYAKLENSPRLQRLHALLQGGTEYTTLEIMQHAKICSVNSAISELRRNGFDIGCKMIGRGVYSYQLKGEES